MMCMGVRMALVTPPKVWTPNRMGDGYSRVLGCVLWRYDAIDGFCTRGLSGDSH